MNATAQILTSLAALVASCAAAYASLSANRTSKSNQIALQEVKHEVKTSNGITIAALADLSEGRRIQADVPVEDRTISEQHYVNKVEDQKA